MVKEVSIHPYTMGGSIIEHIMIGGNTLTHADIGGGNASTKGFFWNKPQQYLINKFW